jgi:hypothetical protein
MPPKKGGKDGGKKGGKNAEKEALIEADIALRVKAVRSLLHRSRRRRLPGYETPERRMFAV